jgi:ankyrin repeat protein
MIFQCKMLRRLLLAGAIVIAPSAGFSAEPATPAPTPLASAAEHHEIAKVRLLVQNGVDVNQTQPDGMTALDWAVYHDDLEMARLLIDAGADVKRANRYGVTPLSLACRNGNPALVELLLAKGADANASLPGGETALMTAARTGSLATVRLLIDRDVDVNAKERRGQTAIMWAAAEGHAGVVRALLDAGADFRTPLPSGFTPLFFAVREGRADVVKVLVDAGADVNEPMRTKRNGGGRAPARGTSPLIMAVENGHFELARMLLEAGADPNDQRCGFTALHTMTWVRKPNRGDDPDGDPPPIGSGNITSLQFVRELVAHGADVNARLERGASGRGVLSRKGATPFLLAAKTDDVPLLRLLLELNADPKLTNVDGCTPLMAAAGIGTLAPGEEAGTEDEAVDAVKLLLDLGADVNAVDKNGETAMHGAAYKSLPKMVALLAERGAKIKIWNHKNKYGWTPLAIAEGYRPGNFKPSPETLAALHRVLLDAGITPPATSKPEIEDKNY